MKRDLDLVRLILKELEEELPPGQSCNGVQIDGYDRPTVNAHLELMIDADLIDGKPLHAMTGIIDVMVNRITWKGYDFIAAAKDDTVWEKTKTAAVKRAGSITFDVLLELLKAEIRTRLGLP